MENASSRHWAPPAPTPTSFWEPFLQCKVRWLLKSGIAIGEAIETLTSCWLEKKSGSCLPETAQIDR